MGYIESTFCKKSEFEKGKEKRLDEEMIDTESLYTVYFSLKEVVAQKKREAAKFPVKLLTKERKTDTGLYVIKISFLNLKQEPVHESSLQSFDGLLTNPDDQLHVRDTTTDPVGDFTVVLGYFKKYESPNNAPDEAEDVIYVPDNDLVLA